MKKIMEYIIKNIYKVNLLLALYRHDILNSNITRKKSIKNNFLNGIHIYKYNLKINLSINDKLN
jgi:hypothetical protein